MVVANGRPLKRMKRRVTADLYNFLTFPSGDEPRRHPFLTTVRSFLTEHALLPHPSSLFPHLLTWQISFRVGDAVVEGSGGAAVSDDGGVGNEVVCLDVVEEDVARSRSVYCDHCRVVGWSGHPVCSKRYHFIIKADGNSSAGYHMPCTCCGDTLHLSELRCKACNHVATADDVEDWVYNQLEVSTHLLHGVVHANGYGHLLRVNGREGGSRFLSGYQIMDFWDRLCKTLGVRKISVMDVSKKYGLEYRLLHAITKGRSWYGEWGYEFGAGSFGLTVDSYKSAIETLSSLPLSNFISQGRKPHTLLQDVILFYQSLSDQELVNIKDLFCYVLSLVRKAHKSSSKVDGSTYKKRLVYPPLAVSPSWGRADIERVEEAMCKVLRAVSGSRWVSWRALRGAICKTAPVDLLDYCLKELGGKQTADGMFVSARRNPDSGALEYRLEHGNASSTGHTYTSASSVVTCPSEEKLVQDLNFLFDSILNPRTMVNCGSGNVRELAVSAGAKLLDCKQFLKNYKPERMILSTNPHVICLSCEVEVVDLPEESVPDPPPEMIILPQNATMSDLKREAAKAFQDIYLLFRRFQIEEVCGFCGVDDSTQVKLLLGTAESVRIRGRCFVKNGLGKYKMERGTDRWTVDCSCGAKDDDGERMLACDACGVWQHTRCSGIPDSESVPAKFVCYKCRGRGQVSKLVGVAHG